MDGGTYYIILSYYIYICTLYIYRNGSEYEFRIMPYSEVVTTGGLVGCSTAVLPGSWSCKGLVLGSSASGLTKSAQFVYAMMNPYERVRIRHLTDALPHSRSIVPIHSMDHRGAIHTRFLTCTYIYIYIHTHIQY